jgi:hypothetical protein
MSQLPPAIIFVNADLNDTTKATLNSQLYIDQVWSDTEFDTIISANPTYPDQVHLNNLRVLVIRQNFMDYTNRDLADVVMFYKQGEVYIEKNKFGPPGQTYPLERLNLYALLRAAGSGYVIILPQNPPRPGCHYPCGCYPKWGPGGIVGIELRAGDPCGVHAPNCDNEYNNEAFINRK